MSVEVTVTRDYRPGVLLLFVAAAWDAGIAIGGGGAYGPYIFPQGSRERVTIAYRLTRESVGWRLALPDQEVAAIQRYPAGTPTRRYALDSAVSAHEVTLHMREAIASKDGTVLLLSIENTGDADAQVLTALSLATLTTEDGRTHNVRLLRSAFPDVIPAGMSGSATLVFEPIPDDTGGLQFSLSGVRVAGDQFDLTVGLQLAPVK